jgi:hypothetical protein
MAAVLLERAAVLLNIVCKLYVQHRTTANDVPQRKEPIMDFIERWFGISPDGGDGSLEAIYVLAFLVVEASILSYFARRSMGWIRRRR